MKEEKIIEEYRGYLSLYHSDIIGDDGSWIRLMRER